MVDKSQSNVDDIRISEEEFLDEIEQISKLLPSSGDVLSQTLKDCESIENDESLCTQLLGAISSRLPHSQPELFQSVLKATSKLPQDFHRAEVLQKIVSRPSETLPLELLPSILDETIKLSSEFHRAEILRDIASQLPSLPSELLPKVLDAINDLPYESDQFKILRAIACWVPDSHLSEILDKALNLEDEFFRVEVLSAIVPRLPKSSSDLLQKAFEAINTMALPDLR